MEDSTPSSDRQEVDVVKILFKAQKCGFGSYDIADPEKESRFVGRKSGYGRHINNSELSNDSKQRRLNAENDENGDAFITDINDPLPSALVGVVTQEEYRQKMTALMDLMSTSKGATIPFVMFAIFFITGFAIDVIWEWFGFFVIILPVFAFFISYDILKRQFKNKAEGLFHDWKETRDVRAIWLSNVAKGNVALLELRITHPASPSSTDLV